MLTSAVSADTGVDLLKAAIEATRTTIESKGGVMTVKAAVRVPLCDLTCLPTSSITDHCPHLPPSPSLQPRVTSARDDTELARLMEQLQLQHEEVDGDDDDDED